MSTAVHPQRRATWHDAFDAQMALWRWYRTNQGLAYMEHHAQDGTESLSVSTREMLFDLYRGEMGRLLDCDPIYISAEMCEVIDAAQATFQPEPLLESDLITPRGFVFFEKPFLIPDRFEQPVTIHAFSWSRIISHKDPATVERINERLRIEPLPPGWDGRNREDEIIAAEGAHASGVAITLYAKNEDLPGAPMVLPMHVTPWWFNMAFDGNEVDENDVPTGAAWWWRIVQTTLRLMQQRIGVKHHHRPDRASRREAKSLGMPDDQEIVVVRLRREAGEPNEPSGEDANYSHRFIVSGHWRNQWYPSEQLHRQIWISPYVKGPEDKPLIVRPRRVFQWNR